MLYLPIANFLTWWVTPDIQSLTCKCFLLSDRSSQTLELASHESLNHHVRRWMTVLKKTIWSFVVSPHFLLPSIASVSREVVEVSVAASLVRGGGEAAVCAPPRGHHYYDGDHCLGSVQLGENALSCWVLTEGSLYLYSAICGCSTLHSCHAKLQSTLFSIGLSVKCFFYPPAVLRPDTCYRMFWWKCWPFSHKWFQWTRISGRSLLSACEWWICYAYTKIKF